MDWSNDTRGWVMCGASAIACGFGASLIYVDILIRKVPRWRDFSIGDSDKFLAACFSLSFGIMLFSSLLDLYPSAMKELKAGGMKPRWATFAVLGLFTAGFVGIGAFSRFLHSYMPSHVVDCDHSHDETQSASRSHVHSRANSHHSHEHSHSPFVRDAVINGSQKSTETSPLIGRDSLLDARSRSASQTNGSLANRLGRPRARSHRRASFRGDNAGVDPGAPQSRRPSMMELPGRVMSFIVDTKSNCDEGGPCFGYTDPCGKECFKHLGGKAALRQTTLMRTGTGNLTHRKPSAVTVVPEEETNGNGHDDTATETACHSDDEDIEAQHHHHVQENAFMDLGLQTSIAIGLHKLPEGFIMFATNHANPNLGFNVFLALFVHNIAEGFAISLPLYLALQSRWKAMLWSCLLGGVSQPLGAAIAAIWFKIAGNSNHAPGSIVYGCLFAVVAGIMMSVAMMLYSEGLSTNHNQNLCTAFALLGMLLLGLSNALTS